MTSNGDFEDISFPQVQLYVRGEVIERLRQGSWAVMAKLDGAELYRVGGEVDTPHLNRAYLTGVIEGLKWAVGAGHLHAVVITDNEYIVRGISRWVMDWHGRRWRTNEGRSVPNVDMWQEVLALSRQVQTIAVLIRRGADGTPERTDDY